MFKESANIPENDKENEVIIESSVEFGLEGHGRLAKETRKEILSIISKSREVFLGAGNYGVVLNNLKVNGEWVCVKLIWEDIQVFEGQEYSDEGDDYIKGLKRIKSYFEEVERQRKEVKEDTKNEFVPQNTPEEEFKKQIEAHDILEGSGIECRVPLPLFSGFDEVDDIDLMEEDDEESRKYSVYSTNKFHVLMMEKIVGKSLSELIDHPGENKEYIDLFLQNQDEFIENLERAVKALNENGVFHGDINTRNIMIDNEGKPVIIDFGANTAIVDRDDIEDLKSVINYLKNNLTIDI